MPGSLDLGGGVSASIVTTPIVGMTLTHPTIETHDVAGTACHHQDRLCFGFVPLQAAPEPREPLTLPSPVTCPHCGQSWQITQGRATSVG